MFAMMDSGSDSDTNTSVDEVRYNDCLVCVVLLGYVLPPCDRQRNNNELFADARDVNRF